MEIAEFIETTRKELGFSRESLAKLLDVNPTTVYRWEKGTATPSEKETNNVALLEALKKEVQSEDADDEVVQIVAVMLGVADVPSRAVEKCGKRASASFSLGTTAIPLIGAFISIGAAALLASRVSKKNDELIRKTAQQLSSRPDLLFGAAVYLLQKKHTQKEQ